MLIQSVLAILALFPLSQDAPEEQAKPVEPLSEEAQDTEEGAASGVERSLETLATIQRSREAKRAEIEQARAELSSEMTDVERVEKEDQIRTLSLELEDLRQDYDSVATGIDVQLFNSEKGGKFNLQNELQELIKPIVEELKSATAEPRQIEDLRAQVNHYGERKKLAEEALANVRRLLQEVEDGDPKALREPLLESETTWKNKIVEIRGDEAVAQFKLDKITSDRSSILESGQEALQNFFRTRGLNLLMALSAFLVTMFSLRWLYQRVAKKLARKSGNERPFYSRLIGVIYMVCVGLISMVAALVVLYASGDWVLLGLTLMFLLGIAWASKTAVPMFLEQIRLLLNLGTVRERERVLLDGVPFRVSKVSFYTVLANPELAGGVRRLPIRDLIDMRSRTCSKDEVWFPCKRGDWVLLSDGTRGVVLHQSPDTVQVEKLGGSRVTYPSGQFLELAPQNLSVGFRLQIVFGIDYEHQAICTTEVPEIFQKDVASELKSQFGEDCYEALNVDFLSAGASSLDYAVIADFVGDMAPNYDAAQRAIQRICVDTCNREGWVIPFAQLTLHQASPAEG